MQSSRHRQRSKRPSSSQPCVHQWPQPGLRVKQLKRSRTKRRRNEPRCLFPRPAAVSDPSLLSLSSLGSVFASQSRLLNSHDLPMRILSTVSGAGSNIALGTHYGECIHADGERAQTKRRQRASKESTRASRQHCTSRSRPECSQGACIDSSSAALSSRRRGFVWRLF